MTSFVHLLDESNFYEFFGKRLRGEAQECREAKQRVLRCG